jgi:hypothetical protein
MEDGARHHESLALVKLDRFVFQIDQEPALDHVEELVLFVVLVPVVLTLDDAHADDGAVDLAERLIEPFVLAALGHRFDVDELEWAVQDVEAGFVREGGGFCHEDLFAKRIAGMQGTREHDTEGTITMAIFRDPAYPLRSRCFPESALLIKSLFLLKVVAEVIDPVMASFQRGRVKRQIRTIEPTHTRMLSFLLIIYPAVGRVQT